MNDSITHDLSEYCVITCHGFTGYPEEMNPLGEFLTKKGYCWKNLTLPGHNTTPEDLKQTLWHDWANYVNTEIEEALHSSKGVFFTGLSLGGTMTLYALETYPSLLGGATLAAAVKVFPFWQELLLKLPIGFWIKRTERDIRDINDPKARSTHHAYLKLHTNSVKQLDAFVKHVKKRLPLIQQPLLIIHSTKDNVLKPSNAEYIYQHVSSTKKDLLFVHKSGHVLTKDYDKEFIFQKIHEFFLEVIQSQAST